MIYERARELDSAIELLNKHLNDFDKIDPTLMIAYSKLKRIRNINEETHETYRYEIRARNKFIKKIYKGELPDDFQNISYEELINGTDSKL